jgi:hypothetical protein
MPQQRTDVLADVVIARALEEIPGTLVVVLQGEFDNLSRIGRLATHR